MLGATTWTGTDLLREGEGVFGASLLTFALLFTTNTLIMLIALAVDLPVRAVLRRRALRRNHDDAATQPG